MNKPNLQSAASVRGSTELAEVKHGGSAFPVLLVALLLVVFGTPLAGLAGYSGRFFGELDPISRLWGMVCTELSNTKISSLHGVSSGVYITPPEQTEPNSCDWRYGMEYKMHWPQLPDFGTTGVDIDASQAILADDFKCTSTGPVTDFHFWASFAGDILPPNEPNSLTFEIRIYSDAPASGDSWSRPDKILWSRIFLSGDYTVRKINNQPSGLFDPMTLRVLPDNYRQAFQCHCLLNIIRTYITRLWPLLVPKIIRCMAHNPDIVTFRLVISFSKCKNHP